MADQGHSSRQDADCRGGAFTIEALKLYLESRISAVETLQNERYHWSLDKFKALDNSTEKALAAVEKQTAAAFAANKESVLKTEEAQKAYNFAHNDLTRKMEQQAGQFVNREKLDDVVKQFDAKFESLLSEIKHLQAGSAETGGRRVQQQENRATSQWTTGQVLSTMIAVIGFGLAIAAMLLKSKP